jgi:hypothetical protein
MAEADTGHAGGTVKIPGFGEVKKKTAGLAALGAVGLVLAYIAFRQHSASGGTAAAGTSATVTDPAGNVCASLDPNSGYCPGSAQDQAFFTDQSGVLAGGTGTFDTGSGFSSSGDSGSVSSTTGPGSFTNNAEWSQFCEASMGSNGADAIAAALGKYITGGEVTPEQVVIIDEAIAIGNPPPIQGPGGRPPSINQKAAPAPGPGPGPTPPPGKGKIVPGTHRYTATGTQTLNQWASSKKTNSGEVETSSEANFTSHYETAANHAKFTAYLNGGSTKKMPKGMVFFSTH